MIVNSNALGIFGKQNAEQSPDDARIHVPAVLSLVGDVPLPPVLEAASGNISPGPSSFLTFHAIHQTVSSVALVRNIGRLEAGVWELILTISYCSNFGVDNVFTSVRIGTDTPANVLLWGIAAFAGGISTQLKYPLSLPVPHFLDINVVATGAGQTLSIFVGVYGKRIL